MTKADMIRILEPLTDEAEILCPDENSGQWVPAVAEMKTRGYQVVIVIQPASWYARGGDV